MAAMSRHSNKKRENIRALFGRKNFNPESFPFIYSTTTGSSNTSYLWLYSVLSNANALKAVKVCSEWTINTEPSSLIGYGKPYLELHIN